VTVMTVVLVKTAQMSQRAAFVARAVPDASYASAIQYVNSASHII